MRRNAYGGPRGCGCGTVTERTSDAGASSAADACRIPVAVVAFHLVGAADTAHRPVRPDRRRHGQTWAGVAGHPAAESEPKAHRPPTRRHRGRPLGHPDHAGAQPVLIGRADDSTLVLTDD